MTAFRSDAGFAHEALFYAGEDGFLAGTLPFLREGAARREPMLVVIAAEKIRKLRAALGADADAVTFADMAGVGRNPARIIPAWQEFIDDNLREGQRVRGIGEPIWAGRSASELVEAQRHESLLNLAFEGSGDWSLLCPYDVRALDAAVLEEAERSHPVLVEDGARRASSKCRGLPSIREPFDTPLPESPVESDALAFDDEGSLGDVRAWVARRALGSGLSDVQAEQLVLAVHEAVANSLRYGDGRGRLRMWNQDDGAGCEVWSEGRVLEAMAGRERPAMAATRGRGLWMANQLCDLVQVRTFPDGSVVRLHMRGDAPVVGTP